ncbi:MAG: hypothetical protein MUP85_10510 [Candidatus Lokiarchaeota archaeon]|nr:hypothetical protein [Candidatus Lokiarchaeota archaeon]
MKKEFYWISKIAVILLLIIMNLLPVSAETTGINCGNVKEIIVEGLSSIQPHEDIANARNRAIADALRHAVERVLGLYIEEETLMENFSKLEITVYKESKGHVVTYEIVEDSEKTEGGIYSLRINATICLEPRILVLIPEKHNGKEVIDRIVESTIIDGLLKAGFSVVGKQERESIYRNPLIKRVLEGDEKAVLELAMYYGANVVIVGKGNSEQMGRISDFYSVRAYLEVQAFKTDEDMIIAAHNLQISGAGITENSATKKAFSLAGEQTADYLVEKFAEFRSPEEIQEVSLLIDNLKSESQFNQLKENIGKMLLVIEVKANLFENKKAELLVKALGDIQELVEDLNTVNFIDLDLNQVNEHTIQIIIK